MYLFTLGKLQKKCQKFWFKKNKQTNHISFIELGTGI